MAGPFSRRPPEPEGPPPELTVTARGADGVETTEVVGFGRPEARPSPSRRRLWLVVGAAVVLVAGGLGAVRWLDGSPSVTADGLPLPVAVTEEPSQAWTYDFDGAYLSSVVGVGDRIVLAEEGGDVIGVDAEGRQEWSYDDHAVSFLIAVPGSDDLVLAAGSDGGTGVLSAADGEEVWWRDEGFPVGLREDLLVVVDRAVDDEGGGSTASRLDPETGGEQWSVDGVENLTTTAEAVMVVDGDQLRRLDADTGEEAWAIDGAGQGVSQLIGTGELVAVARGDLVTAYDTRDGERLWSWQGRGDRDAQVALGVYAEDRLYVGDVVYDSQGDVSAGEVSVRDRDGEVGSFEVGDREFLAGIALEADGDHWFLNLGSGDLYDDRVEVAAHYDGQVDPTDRGVYVGGDGTLSFYPYGDTDPTWEIDVDRIGNTGILVVDGAVLVSRDGTLTAYR